MKRKYKVVIFNGKRIGKTKRFEADSDTIALREAQRYVGEQSWMHLHWLLTEEPDGLQPRNVAEVNDEFPHPLEDLSKEIKRHGDGLYGFCMVIVDTPRGQRCPRFLNVLADRLTSLGHQVRTHLSPDIHEMKGFHQRGTAENEMYVVLVPKGAHGLPLGMMPAQMVFNLTEDRFEIVKSRCLDTSARSAADSIVRLVEPYLLHDMSIVVVLGDMTRWRESSNVSAHYLMKYIEASTGCRAIVHNFESLGELDLNSSDRSFIHIAGTDGDGIPKVEALRSLRSFDVIINYDDDLGAQYIRQANLTFFQKQANLRFARPQVPIEDRTTLLA